MMEDYFEDFRCKNGKMVRIRIPDDEYVAQVTDMNGDAIGKLEFYECDGNLKLAWAYLDKQEGTYLHQGIGRRCIDLMRERSGMLITAADNDGQTQEDGSHLTGDAPGFVAALRREGLILHSRQSAPDDD